MNSLKIASFNVRSFDNQFSGKSINNAKVFIDFFSDFDIVGTQEMTYNYLKNICKEKKFNFNITGEYRNGNNLFLKYLPFNEGCHIFSKFEILNSQTFFFTKKVIGLPLIKRLPFSKTQITRIANITLIETDNFGELCLINIHFDYTSKLMQINQLNELKKILKEYYSEYLLILMGDFNMEIQESHFKKFIDEINLGFRLKRVPID